MIGLDIIYPIASKVAYEREYLAKDLPVQELLTIANKDMNDNINNI